MHRVTVGRCAFVGVFNADKCGIVGFSSCSTASLRKRISFVESCERRSLSDFSFNRPS